MSDRVTAFLAGMTHKPPPQRANLIFALDATASREPTWDLATQLQGNMFRAAMDLGGLDVKLIYYRGASGINAECKASSWTSD